jgi:ABC-2 type transport system ATP-binding protein
MEEAQRLCDRIGIMDNGRLIALGTVSELVSAHGGEGLLTAECGGRTLRMKTKNPAAELARLQASGEPLSRFSLELPSLETVFLNLTGRHLRD